MAPAQPPIGDYVMLADCHTAALVSRAGSVDWWCPPRFDAGSVFGALLDPRAGSCRIEVHDGEAAGRNYLDGTLIAETELHAPGGAARLLDWLPFEDPLDPAREHRCLLRVVEGVRGAVTVTVTVQPRFDYGAVAPWIRHHGRGVYSAIGGNDALVCALAGGDGLRPDADDRGTLVGTGTVHPGERLCLSLAFRRPETVDRDDVRVPEPEQIDASLEATTRAWRDWSSRARVGDVDPQGVRRSAMVLKGLTYAPTGAMVAAATTSLPEAIGDGDAHRCWDYRFAWIRDSVLTSRSLTELGYEEEAGAFRRFIERSAAGSAADLQVLYGVAGERRLHELELDGLAGYHGAGPVRAGNDASTQLQLDAYGHLVEQSWRWAELGHQPDDDYWRFLLELVDAAAEHWNDPDRGIWEWRGEPRHFVHSKVMCWVALDRGLALAERCLRKAPERRWRRAREEVREAVLDQGFDAERGTFRQSFGDTHLDAALLRIPTYGFLPYDDERMVGTVDAIMADLDDGGLLRRYDAEDGLPGREGAFVPCTFWLVECLVGQGRAEEARAAFDRALSAASDLGLFSEEADARAGMLLGNFPQALTHLAHIEAALMLPPAASGA